MALRLREVAAVARIDAHDVLRSRWLFVLLGVYAALAAVFVLVGTRESTVRDFTGMGRVLFSFTHALLFVLPLVALSVAGPVIGRARHEGALELLLGNPIGRSEYLCGVTLVRFAVLVVPLAAVSLALALAAGVLAEEAVPWALLGRTLVVSGALLWAFAALGLAISAGVRSPARASTGIIFAWLVAVALADLAVIGLLLRFPWPPEAVLLLAAANPVEAARLALVAAAQPDLAALGPVGVYSAERLGAAGLLVLGTAWPFVFGLACWLGALGTFRRQDLV